MAKYHRGKNNADDVFIGTDGDDVFDGFQGSDTYTGRAGADTVKVHSWASSNITYGVDTWTDFSVAEGDKIDLSRVSFYSDTNGDGSIGFGDVTRDLTWADLTLVPLDIDADGDMDGNTLTAPVWEGDATWDVTMIILGDTPTADSMIF